MARDPSTYRANRRNNWHKAWVDPEPKPPASKSKRFVVGLGGAATVIGLVAASLSPAGILNMTTAFVMLWAAWIVGTATVFVSEWLWEFPKKHRWVAGLVVSALLGAALYAFGAWEREQSYQLLHLVAGNDPTPQNRCAAQDGKNFFVFLGRANVSVSKNKFPRNIVIMGRDRDNRPLPMLTINKTERGISIAKLLVFGRNGKVITSINEDKPWTNSNFHSEKESKSKLVVYDEQEQPVLTVNYLNATTIEITGVFRHPRMAPLIIDDKGIFAAGFTSVGGCNVDNANDYFLDGPAL